MRIHWFRSVLLIAAAGIAVAAWSPVRAGDLIVDLGKAVDISMVGAVQRWDEEGKPRFPVDPKAKIAEPRVNARAVRQGSGKWIFRNLPPAAFECGAIVNPDHLRNQVEGCLIMGLGAALFEAIRFENGKILNPRFSRYPGPGSATSLRSTLSCAIARNCPRPAVERPPSSPSPRPSPTPSIAPRETGCGRCRWCRKEWSRVNQVFQFCA
jgi:hypothetical protein